MTEKKLVKEQMMLTFAYDPAYMPKPKGWPLVYSTSPNQWNGVEVLFGHDKADPTITVRDLDRQMVESGNTAFDRLQNGRFGWLVTEKDAESNIQRYGFHSFNLVLSSGIVASLCEVTLDEASDGDEKRVIHKIKVLGSLSAVFGSYLRSFDKSMMQELYPDEPFVDNELNFVVLGYDFLTKFAMSPSLVIEANGEQLNIVLVNSDGFRFPPGAGMDEEENY